MLRGQCLPYGDGITYWPLAEVVREILRSQGAPGADAPDAAIARLLAGEEKAALIGELIAEAVGLGGSGAGTGEATSWAVRKLFEALAKRRPLVVVFDDLQWAEPTFIELIDYLAELSRGTPILLLCMARPELFDTHPSWGGGKLNATSMLLEPLADADCRRADRESARPRPTAGRRRDADREGGRRQRALRRGAPRDARRRRAARMGERSLGGRARLLRPPRPADDLDPPDRAARGPARGRARAARARVRRGHALPSQRDRRARIGVAGGGAREQPHEARAPRRAAARPLDLRRRRGLPLPPPPHPRRRVPLALEGDARRPARALRGLARACRRRSSRRVRGDRGLPPRTGVPLPERSALAGRRSAGARCEGVVAARVGRPPSARAQRSARRHQPARARGVARRGRRGRARGAPARARRGHDRGRPARRRRARPRRGRRGRRGGRGRAGGVARARAEAVPAAPARQRGRDGGGDARRATV